MLRSLKLHQKNTRGNYRALTTYVLSQLLHALKREKPFPASPFIPSGSPSPALSRGPAPGQERSPSSFQWHLYLKVSNHPESVKQTHQNKNTDVTVTSSAILRGDFCKQPSTPSARTFSSPFRHTHTNTGTDALTHTHAPGCLQKRDAGLFPGQENVAIFHVLTYRPALCFFSHQYSCASCNHSHG